jgi:choice-of-anchor C domain-containing protein
MTLVVLQRQLDVHEAFVAGGATIRDSLFGRTGLLFEKYFLFKKAQPRLEKGGNVKKLILSFCVASLLGVTGIADALPFQNGSFENPGAGAGVTTLFSVNTSITGWTVVNGSIDYLGSPWQAAEGTSSIDMSGILTPGILTQNFDTVGGTLYEVIFAMAGNPLGGDKIKDLGVSVANFSKDFTFDTSGKTITDMGWTNFSFTFLATDLLTTLTFTSLENNAFGAALDNVRVDVVANGGGAPVPEPATMLLLGTGFTGLAFFGRKKFMN